MNVEKVLADIDSEINDLEARLAEIEQVQARLDKLRQVRGAIVELADSGANGANSRPPQPARRNGTAERASQTSSRQPGARGRFSDEKKREIVQRVQDARATGVRGAVSKAIEKAGVSWATVSAWEKELS